MSAVGPALHHDAPHESAVGHVTGRARYVDDLPEPPGLLHAVLVTAPMARGRALVVDAVGAGGAEGVVAVLTAADIPGDPYIGPIVHDEPLLALDQIGYHGQPVAVVLAEGRELARRAAEQVVVRAEPLEPVLGIEQGIAAGRFHTAPHTITRGDVEAALAGAHLLITGEVQTPAQDHFYLETQCALAIPGEGGSLEIWSSTQHPTEVQRATAGALRLPQAAVSCRVPRMGGGFGGKESQATQPAVLAALGARHTGRPVKLWLDRSEDMRITGKRHPFLGRYRAGFDADGRLLGLEVQLYSDGGWTADLSGPVMDRALFHLDNAYHVPALRFSGRVVQTDLPSNTAFRGFGGPQGIYVVEDALERAASRLGLPPEAVRRRNYYGDAPRDQTPYGQRVPGPPIAAMHDRLVRTAGLSRRRGAIAAANAVSRHTKRGLGLVPVKFGISFTASLLNQAGALVLVYADGTVQLNHGGTEMGQGLHTKVRAVCADVLGVPVDTIRVMDTSTDKIPNTSATAASSGSDLNGAAVAEAARRIRERMVPIAASLLGLDEGTSPTFRGGEVYGEGRSISFAEVANACWVQQIPLSATGFYRTPGIAYDPQQGRGTPFFYFAWGIALVEVEVLGLTGEHRIQRVDILHDVGNSLIPNIDVGQIEGAFVQGVGWLTGEEVIHGDDGRCLTHGPSTYKVPSVGDVPLQMRIELLDQPAEADTIGRSKAVGEPPFVLGIAVISALRDAIGAFGGAEAEAEVELALPATPEAILRAVEAQRAR